MIWLVLAISCSLSIAMLFKFSERHGMDRNALLAVNYLVASFVSVVWLIAEGAEVQIKATPGLVGLGVWTGVLFIVGFIIFAYAIREAGMGLATGVMRIAVVLPVLASWFVWKEVPTTMQLAGLALACAAFFLIAKPAVPLGSSELPQTKRQGIRIFGVLAILFLSGGLVDVSMKTFGEVYASTNSRGLFLLLVFCVAFFIGLGLVVSKGVRTGEWPERRVCGWGIILGIVNYGSAAFILGAIAVLPGPFVFPANNIALIAGAAALGVGVWGERLSRTNWAGLGMATVAFALLWG